MMRHVFHKNVKVSAMNSSMLSVIVLGSVFAACTQEPVRRSAVDAASICGTNADKPVWKGECLRTQSVQAEADAGAAPSEPEPVAPGDKSPPESVRVEPGDGAGERPGAPVAPVAPAAPAAPAKPDPDQQKADAIKVITDAIDKHGADAVAGIEKTLNRGQTTKVYVVTFSKDSFVGIADNSVVKNCFVGAGSVVEVKGQPLKVTEFSSMGVNQYVTGEALEVNVAGGSSDDCGLKGKDFVYIGGHASVAAKP